jgi:uridine nucleosidase
VLDLIGISTVYGNASLDRTTKNALSVLEAIGKSEICVHPGASKPFCRDATYPTDIHGVHTHRLREMGPMS